MVSNSSPWLITCKAALRMLCPLWDPRTKEMQANGRESSRVLLGWLEAGAYAVLEESGGTALFSLKTRRLKMDLIATFHYLKGRLLEQMESDSSQTCLHWHGVGQLQKKTVTSCGRRKSDGILGREEWKWLSGNPWRWSKLDWARPWANSFNFV